MPISHLEIRKALAARKKWAKTATIEELRASILRANPPIEGLDPSPDERYKPRKKSKRTSKARGK